MKLELLREPSLRNRLSKQYWEDMPPDVAPPLNPTSSTSVRHRHPKWEHLILAWQQQKLTRGYFAPSSPAYVELRAAGGEGSGGSFLGRRVNSYLRVPLHIDRVFASSKNYSAEFSAPEHVSIRPQLIILTRMS